MTESFTLSDLDPFARAEDGFSHDISLHIEARYVDGSSRAFELVGYDMWDAHSIICDLVDEDLADRLNQLSPSDRDAYDSWFEPETAIPSCTCQGCCFCYDQPNPYVRKERAEALHRWTRGGVRLTWCWQPFGISGSQTVAASNTGDECDEYQLDEVIDVDSFIEDNGIELGAGSGNDDRHAGVSETFDLVDVDVAIDEIDPDDYFIEIREISADGTSEIHVLHDPDDLQSLLIDLNGGQDGTRLAGLTPEQRERYDRFEEETECRCDGSCDVVCWLDLSEQEQWLDEVAPNNCAIEWVWMLNEKTRGPEGGSVLTACNTVIDEGPGVAGDIWRQVEWD